MRFTTFFATSLVLCPLAAGAQNGPRAEIGTALGVTIDIPDDGDALTSVGIPGAGSYFGTSSLYATIFTDGPVTVEPQLGVTLLTGGGETVWTTSAIVQLGYLFTPEQDGSGYAAVQGGLLAAGNGDSEASGVAGAGIGYRYQVASGAAIRIEGVYRRWFGSLLSDLNTVAVRFAVGAVIPRTD